MKGTWQTSGFDFASLIGAAVLIGAAAAVMEFVLKFIWYIVAILAMVAIGFVIGLLSVRRKVREHAAELEATRPARHAALAPRREVPAALPLAIEQHVHYETHYHAAPDSPARIVIPGHAGHAITEEDR
jgi:hypothetical protein